MFFFVLIFSIIIILLVANEYYYRVAGDYTQDFHMRKGEKGGPYDAIAFGSAYCRYGLDFSGTEINGYNYGYGSQFLYYTNLMLRRYAKTCKPGGVVYLIIADLVFARKGKGLYGADQYVKFLDKEDLDDEYSLYQWFKGRFQLLFHPRLIRTCLKRLLRLKKNNLYTDLEHNQFDEKMVEIQATKRCQSWCRQFGLKDTISGDISAELEGIFIETRQILTDMIQYCIDHNLRPILVVTPVSRIMNEKLSHSFMKKVLFDNIKIANKQNVPFFNYLWDDEFSDSDYYCNSSDLLNLRGRKFFTRKLVLDSFTKK